MTTLVLSQRMSRDSVLIESAASKLGYQTIRISGSNSNTWASEVDLVAYCEGFMAEYVSQQSDMVLLRPLDIALSSAPISLTKRQIKYTKAANLPNAELPAFIKPTDQKFFKAGIFSNLDELTDYIDEYPDDPVFISEVAPFGDEYRCFVLDGQIVTSSPYMIQSQYVGDNPDYNKVPKVAVDFAQACVDQCKYHIPPGCVVDVGTFHSGELGLIEFNPAWASGIYNCDPEKALNCIAASCINRSSMTQEMKKYETFDCS